jgi:hypothetical protein
MLLFQAIAMGLGFQDNEISPAVEMTEHATIHFASGPSCQVLKIPALRYG